MTLPAAFPSLGPAIVSPDRADGQSVSSIFGRGVHCTVYPSKWAPGTSFGAPTSPGPSCQACLSRWSRACSVNAARYR